MAEARACSLRIAETSTSQCPDFGSRLSGDVLVGACCHFDACATPCSPSTTATTCCSAPDASNGDPRYDALHARTEGLESARVQADMNTEHVKAVVARLPPRSRITSPAAARLPLRRTYVRMSSVDACASLRSSIPWCASTITGSASWATSCDLRGASSRPRWRR